MCDINDSFYKRSSPMFWNNLLDQVQSGEYRKNADDSGKDNSATEVRKQKREQRHYVIMVDDREISLTRREAECVDQVMRGNTFVQTGETLGLSNRTVEYYLNNVKTKMQVKKIEALKVMAWRSNFQEIIDFKA